MTDYSVENEEGYARTYTEDEMVSVRKGDLRALLDLATGSLDFGSGFWNEEDVEVALRVAEVLDVDRASVVPSHFQCKYFGHVPVLTTTPYRRAGSCERCGRPVGPGVPILATLRSLFSDILGALPIGLPDGPVRKLWGLGPTICFEDDSSPYPMVHFYSTKTGQHALVRLDP